MQIRGAEFKIHKHNFFYKYFQHKYIFIYDIFIIQYNNVNIFLKFFLAKARPHCMASSYLAIKVALDKIEYIHSIHV